MGNTTGSDESADWSTVEVTEGDDYGFITGPPPLYQMVSHVADRSILHGSF
jgi:hypothetical protein